MREVKFEKGIMLQIKTNTIIVPGETLLWNVYIAPFLIPRLGREIPSVKVIGVNELIKSSSKEALRIVLEGINFYCRLANVKITIDQLLNMLFTLGLFHGLIFYRFNPPRALPIILN